MLVCLVTGFSASAQTAFEEVELDKVYENIPTMVDHFYKFTASQDGILYCYGTSGEFPKPFVDEACETPAQYNYAYAQGTIGDLNYGAKYDMGVKAGTTYYFKHLPMSSSLRFMFTMSTDVDLKVVSCEPAENSVFDITGAGQLNVTLTHSVNVGEATLQLGNNVAEVVESHVGNSTLMFELRNNIYNALKDGRISGGEEMVVTVKDVCASSDPSIKYGEDGALVLKFICPTMPAKLQEAVLPETFLSYWMPGDPDALCKLVFDKELATGDAQPASVTISFGYADAGDYYTENIPFSVEGNTFSFDLSGKLRTPEIMSINGTDWGSIDISVNGIHLADGTLVYAEGQGQLGSFSYNIPYEVRTNDFSTEFTPAYGASIKDTESIEIWISNETALTYDGVNIVYEVNGTPATKYIAKSDINEVKANGEMTLTFSVPDEVKNADNVIVRLDAQFTDGIERDIKAKYNITAGFTTDLKYTSAAPAAESYVTSLKTIELTYPEEIFVNAAFEGDQVEVYNKETRIKVTTGTVAKKENNRKVAVITLAEEITEETMTDPLTGEPARGFNVLVGEGVIGDADCNATSFVSGRVNPALTLPYIVNSEIATAEVRAIPEDGSHVEELSSIEIWYPTQKQIGPTYNEDKHIYLLNSKGIRIAEGALGLTEQDNKLKITFDKTITAAGTYTLAVGDSVLYTGTQYDAEPNAPVEFTYYIDGEAVSATDDIEAVTISPASESVVQMIDEIAIEFFDPNDPEGDYPDLYLNSYMSNAITVFDRVNRIQVGSGSAMVSKGNRKMVLVKLDKPVAADGVYMVEMPAGTVGDMDYINSGYAGGRCNSTIICLYEVKSDAGQNNITVDPADGSEVESLSRIRITFNDEEFATPTWASIYGEVRDAAGNLITTTDDGNFGDTDNQVVFALKNEITDAGTYTVTFPEGMITLGEWGDIMVGELKFTYIIGGGGVTPSDVVTDPADGSEVEKLNTIIITFNNYEDCAPSYNDYPKLLNEADEIVTGADVDFGGTDWIPYNYCKIMLNEEVTTPGTYTLDIPAATFTLDGEDSPAMQFTYIVKGASGVSGVYTEEADRYDVYTISGVRVMSTEEKEALNGLNSGLYIINGKKVIIK